MKLKPILLKILLKSYTIHKYINMIQLLFLNYLNSYLDIFKKKNKKIFRNLNQLNHYYNKPELVY
jgi:hypothetical protein